MRNRVIYRARRSSNHTGNTDGTLKVIERRSKHGCLTCRKRRKKCDEVKPICSACGRNFLQCVWQGDTECGIEMPRTLEATEVEFSNLTIHDLKLFYSSCGTMISPKYRKTRKNEIVDNFITLSVNKGVLELKQNGRMCLITDQFPNTEQLDGFVEMNLNNKNTIARSAKHDTDKTPNDIFDTAPDISDHRDFFDLQYISHQVLQKSDFAFDWFTRSDNLEDASNKEIQNLNTINNNGIPLYPLNKANKKIHYNYLYDMNDPIATKYDEIMNMFDRGDMSMLKEICADEHFLIYACVHKWLPKMGPQDTHPLLTTAATFATHLESNYVVKEVFMCCGATYLEWYEYEIFGLLSNELYQSSLALIEKYLEENSYHGTEAWLLASYQLLCLRNKTTSNTTVADCVYCLSNSYRIIKTTYYVSEKILFNSEQGIINSKFLPSTTEQVHELAYEIENKVLEIEEKIDSVKNHLILQPHERMFIESFIYNYSVAILWSIDIDNLPNPFNFFKEISHLLRCPIYHCEHQWMNNPILGATLDGFEILAKVSYITRLPMPLQKKSVWLKKCQHLLTMSQFYTSPIIIPRTNEGNYKNNENCMLNIFVGKVISKVCYLLLCKILNYETYNIAEAQPIVDEVLEIMEKIPGNNLIWGIMIWPLILCGMFVTKPMQQSQILKYLNNIGKLLNKSSIMNCTHFLEKNWSTVTNNERLNVLFDKKNLVNVNP